MRGDPRRPGAADLGEGYVRLRRQLRRERGPLSRAPRRGEELVTESDAGLLVRPDVARAQIAREVPLPAASGQAAAVAEPGSSYQTPLPLEEPTGPRRYHGTVDLDPIRVGLEASTIADEILGHLTGQPGASVRVTLEIEAELPKGAPGQVVRTVTENARTLKFKSQGFEKE